MVLEMVIKVPGIERERLLVSRSLMLRTVREVKNHGKSIMLTEKDLEIHYRTYTRYLRH